MSTLLPVFEQYLADAPATASYDALRHSVVILMGTLAKHLDHDDPKVRPIVGLLIETLSTPSQQVGIILATARYEQTIFVLLCQLSYSCSYFI